jgi:hypothetical protein
MSASLEIKLILAGVAALVFLGMIVFQLVGRSYGARRPSRLEGATGEGGATIFALLGLLVAFSFSGSELRLQNRRELIVREVDAIDTAYLRLDLLPPRDREAEKQLFREYVDARIAYYRGLADLNSARHVRDHALDLQGRIWERAVKATERSSDMRDMRDMRASLVLLPALNEMFDVTTARDAAMRMHIPFAVFMMLALLSAACAFLAGMNMARAERINTLYVCAYAATMALTAWVIINIEFPRAGFVRMDFLDAFMTELRAKMGS